MIDKSGRYHGLTSDFKPREVPAMSKKLTRPLGQTVAERAAKDPEFVKELVKAVAEAEERAEQAEAQIAEAVRTCWKISTEFCDAGDVEMEIRNRFPKYFKED